MQPCEHCGKTNSVYFGKTFCYIFVWTVLQLMWKLTLKWAASPCHFWLPWSGQRWRKPRQCTAHWAAAARRRLAQPGRSSPSTPAVAPQLGPCGNIWGICSKLQLNDRKFTNESITSLDDYISETQVRNRFIRWAHTMKFALWCIIIQNKKNRRYVEGS